MISENSERPFLIYANASLLDDPPKELQKIFDTIQELWPEEMPNTLWRIFLTAIHQLCNFEPSSDESLNLLKNSKYHTKSYVSSWVIYEACYYHSYSCDCTKNNICRSNRYRQHVHQYFASLGHNKIKCYQCDQIAFHLFLKKLIDGEIFDLKKSPYDNERKTIYFISTLSTIDDFKDIFSSNLKFVTVNNMEFQKGIIGDIAIDENTTRGWENIASLQDLILGLIADDLIDFINFSDYKLLKRCDLCKQFYIAKKINPKQRYCQQCSRKNKMTPKERADYQKTYRANPAQIKNLAKRKREKRIQYLMTNAGKTRKEAEIITDSEM